MISVVNIGKLGQSSWDRILFLILQLFTQNWAFGGVTVQNDGARGKLKPVKHRYNTNQTHYTKM